MRALVVGATGGLGSAFTTLLTENASVDEVVAWSRTPLTVTSSKLHAAFIDLRDESSIQSAASTLGEVDLVLVASGLLHDSEGLQPERTWRTLDRAAMLRSFEINTIGPALVAKHVLPHLPRGRRAVFALLSARVGSISDNRLGGWHSYRASKAALNQLIKCFAVELKTTRPEAIFVGLHPGTVDTNLSKPFQTYVAAGKLFSPEQSASLLLGVLDTLSVDQSGRVFDWDGLEVVP